MDHAEDTTFWIDKTALVFRKQVKHFSAYSLDNANRAIRIPYLQDSTTVYPVADWNPQIAPDAFIFKPPVGAKEVAKLEPDYYTPVPWIPKTSLTGQPAPDVSFTASDGSQVPLRSLRGKPVLLDLWATWCGPCLASMPAFDRIYRDVKDKGIAVVTADQGDVAQSAAEYLDRHRYSWTNYHDPGRKVATAFKNEAISMTILIDAQGKIVYYGFGGDEAAVRKAIAALGSEFASIAR
jgi:thiol-disulfide isomerase/thioredoxin